MKRILIALALNLAGLASAQTSQVWQHHIDAWQARDLDAIVADYDDSSVVLIRNRIFRGRSEIRKVFQTLFATFDRATEHVIAPAVLEGKIVYITWHATIDGVNHPFGTDTFVIENDRITYQTITSDEHIFHLP